MRVFVSFHPEQRELAREIIAKCHAQSIDADFNDLKLKSIGKGQIQSYLQNEIRKFDLVVVVWSEQYRDDPWLNKELLAIQSLAADHTRGHFVFPVLADSTPLPGTFDDIEPVDLRENIEEGIAKLVARLPAENQVFIVMKFGDPDLDSTYSTVIRPTLQRHDLQPVRIDEVQNSESITREILKYIEGASLVLCDLTGERPNVYFEAGYALALRKEVILTAQKGSKVHFDLSDRRTIFWTTPADLQEQLTARLEAIQSRRRGSPTDNRMSGEVNISSK